MSWLLTFLGIVVLVLIHEAGHFLAAKAVGMKVERFSLFFPPTLLSVRIGETEYAIGAIPLGGYVKIAGMGPAERVLPKRRTPEPSATPAAASAAHASPPPAPGAAGDVAGDAAEGVHAHLEAEGAAGAEEERGYFRQAIWKRIVVIAAGPAANVMLAFLILWGVYALSAQRPLPGRVGIAEVQSGRPVTGVLRKGDVLLAVNAAAVAVHQAGANFVPTINADRCLGAQVNGCRAARPVTLTVLRGGRRLLLSAYPRYDVSSGRMLLGFAYKRVLVHYGVLAAATASVSELGDITSRTLSVFGKMFTSAHARSELHTIVGVSDIASQAFSFGVPDAMLILALLSLSLAIVNLFPFLPLDGGHIFWALAEKLRGRAIPFAVMERASILGMALVLAVFAIGLTNDINALQNGSLKLSH